MKRYITFTIAVLSLLALGGCNKDFLVEKPVNDIYAENLLVDYSGFESMNYAMMAMMRMTCLMLRLRRVTKSYLLLLPSLLHLR